MKQRTLTHYSQLLAQLATEQADQVKLARETKKAQVSVVQRLLDEAEYYATRDPLLCCAKTGQAKKVAKVFGLI